MQDGELRHSIASSRGPASMAGRAIGPFRLERELGRGSDGVVYLARREGGGPPVALKLLHATSLDDDGRARFEREAGVLRALDHPGVVRLVEAGTHGAWPWYAMEFCAGSTLQERLRAGPLGVRAAVELALALSQALARAHATGIVHRDLKPANVILEAGTGRPRLTDFGLAKWSLGDSLTRTGDMLGTPAYMAPEQFQDSKHVDDRADVWALGVILYECLTGARPFQASSVPEHAALLQSGRLTPPSTLQPGVDPRLDEVCRRALARDPTERPTAAELAVSLAGWLAAPPIPAAPRGRSGLLAAGALGLVGVGALLGWLLTRSALPEPEPAAVTQPAAPAPGLDELRRALAAPEPWDLALERRARAAGPELALDLAAWLCWRGRTREALDLLAGLPEPGTRGAVLSAWCHALHGDLGPPHVQRDVEEALARCGDAPLARVLLGLVVMHSHALQGERGADLEAQRLVERAIDEPVDDAGAILAQALMVFGGGERTRERAQERVRGLRARLEPLPQDAPALLARGLIAYAMGDTEPAREAFLRGHRLLGGRVLAFSTLYTLAKLSSTPAAMDALTATLEPGLDGPDGAARLTRMDLRRRRGDEAGARADLAWLLARPDALVAAGRGILDRTPELLVWADRTLGTAEGGGLLAWPADEVPACAESPALVARAEAAAPAARAALLEAIRAAVRGAPPEEVLSALERARAAAPDDAALACERARLSVARDLERAEEALERARALAPGRRAELELLTGVRHLRRGRVAAAREVLARLAAAEAGAAGRCAAAELALLDGDPAAARVAAEQALALDPGSLPATVALAQALGRLDPRAADALIQAAVRERQGWEDARLAAAGVELAARARLFSIALLARWGRGEGEALQARQARLQSLSRGVWVVLSEAEQALLVTPYFARFDDGVARCQRLLEQAREQESDRPDLRLAEGAAALTVHALRSAPPAPAEPCLAAWAEALASDPGLALPPWWVDRFARQHPDHALLRAWRAEEPRRDLTRFLAERLRARR